MLRELCETYTKLSDTDILILENLKQMLPLIARAIKADVFIDCLTNIPNIAIVVAEAKQSQEESMYQYSVVGKFALGENEPAALRTLETGVSSRDLKALTQENKTVRQNVEPIKNKKGQVIGVLIIEQDITKDIKRDKEMEDLLEITEKLTETLSTLKRAENTIIHHVNEAIIMFNSKGIATYCNPEASQLYKKLGYQDEIIGLSFNNLTLGGMSFSGVIHKDVVNVVEVKIGKLSLRVKYVAMEDENEVIGFIMIIKDVTEVKEKEMELVSKSVAISEIHHRVKNNLQTIASLLRLQSRRIHDGKAKQAFNESISRILSIAITHELLAQKGLDDVDLRTILEKIKESIMSYVLSPEKNIRIHIEGDPIIVNSDKATSIALVVNELLQNSLEHGFDGREEGNIQISIQKGEVYTQVTVIDNGVGFDTKTVKRKSLGLSIVKSIVRERLYGNLQMNSNEDGTEIRFNFKNE
ncbi:Two-component sensor histidine kinase, contains HisKA and HATPase domains [Anaerovirgula multivorans]|uniref:histidine kinase n=1 Tax=Anaerovirgula multivorans TaxID=312168 RepID=A0A239BZU0_9FIRM|nr:histidine kinase N-terminal domain-containing protein [Anaerovirgula multivorans]SNS12654.1 Two-component sensor histidine kinase, contains HisKA and HATPase domains [Anaerovirgula multivorans]